MACTEDGEKPSHKTREQHLTDAYLVWQTWRFQTPFNAIICGDVDRVPFFNKSRSSFPTPAFSAYSTRQEVAFKISSVVWRVPRMVRSPLIKLGNNLSQMQSWLDALGRSNIHLLPTCVPILIVFHFLDKSRSSFPFRAFSAYEIRQKVVFKSHFWGCVYRGWFKALS